MDWKGGPTCKDCCCLKNNAAAMITPKTPQIVKKPPSAQDPLCCSCFGGGGGAEAAVTSCGLCSLRPGWLQPLANKKVFLAVFCLTSVLQGMYYTYFVSVLTTIEKLYQVQSKTTGLIMSATEAGQIGGALLLTYYGGQGHRPKWIACGMLVFAAASMLCAAPHFLYSDRLDADAKPFAAAHNSSQHQLRSKLCQLRTSSPSSWDNNNSRSAPDPHSGETAWGEECGGGGVDRGASSRTTNTVLVIFFVSLLLIGIGATAVYTLGIPYIDDNVATRESPLYFGITIGVRIFGPVFGFLLGSFCTSIYVNFPFGTTELTTDNPQWVGAWWLGVLIVGAALVLTAFPMMAFPRELRRGGPHRTCRLCPTPQQPFYATKPSLKDFPSAIRRLLKNEILLYRTASSVLHILPIAGLYTFLPKYLESQFQLTATMANMISGMAGILVMGVGIFASGTFMRKYKPDARFVARWIALSAALYAIGMVLLMMFGCPLNTYVGLNAGSEYEDQSRPTCNATCHCKAGEFAPICTSEGVTYLSPCLAGCTKVSGASYEEYKYEDCLCLGPNVTAVNGFCPLQCDSLIPYIFVFALFVLAHSTSEVGSMLLTLRCVEPKDKAMALGLISFAIGLFGNVPCPIIYGAVVDSACLFWEDNCGEPGACRLYDPSKFRKVFHGVTSILMAAAFCVDLVVLHKAKAIHFQDEEEEEEEGDGEEEEEGEEEPEVTTTATTIPPRESAV